VGAGNRTHDTHVGGEFELQAFELDKVLWQRHAATVRQALP